MQQLWDFRKTLPVGLTTSFMSAPVVKWKKTHYKCIQCNKGYTSLYWMLWHNRTFHLKGEQPCPCWISYCEPHWAKELPKCKAVRCQTGSTQFTCRLCPAKYARSESLVRHLRINHFNWTYGCAYCLSRFSHRRTALRHVKGCHPGCPVHPMTLCPPPYFLTPSK